MNVFPTLIAMLRGPALHFHTAGWLVSKRPSLIRLEAEFFKTDTNEK